MRNDQDDAECNEYSEHGLTLCHASCGKHTPCQSGLVDNAKIRVLL